MDALTNVLLHWNWQTLAEAALLVALATGCARAGLGPALLDRLLGVLFTSTSGAGLLLLMAHDGGGRGLVDAALALVVLGPVLTAACLAFTRSDATR